MCVLNSLNNFASFSDISSITPSPSNSFFLDTVVKRSLASLKVVTAFLKSGWYFTV